MRSFFALLLLPALASAQRSPVVLVVDPAPEAKPALRYGLMPSSRDRVAGNAVLHYRNAYAARPSEEREPAKRTAENEMVMRWEEAKIGDLPIKDVAEYLKKYKAVFRELEYGARCTQCEWASAPTSGVEAVAAIVGGPPWQRELARWLSLRCKLELAEQRFDDALRTIQTGLQFGKHVAEGPSLIQMLVGNALVSIFLARIDSLIELPDSPNLYWALSSLPKPFLDPRPGLDGEDLLNESFLPGLAELRKGPATLERAIELCFASMKAFQGVTESNGLGDFALRIALIARAESTQDDARKDSIARGRAVRDVAAMPAVQVVFLNSFERYRDIADDYRKWFLLGGPEASAGIEKLGERVKKLKADAKDDPITQVFLNVLAGTEKTYQSLARTERKIAQLRVLEAIRLHTALSTQLPKELADIKKVPVPNDPTTGRPFEYTLTESGFALSPAGLKDIPSAATLKYDVTLRVKK